MVKYQLTGERAAAFLKASQKSDAHFVEQLTFVVRSVSDARAVAAYLGIDIPAGRGRFPMTRLESEIVRLGHKLNRDDYENGTSTTNTYRVSLFNIVDDIVHPRTGIVTTDQIREYSTGQRGRVSNNVIAETAINVHDWEDTYLTDSVMVERLD